MNILKAGLATHRLTKLALDDYITEELRQKVYSNLDETKHPKLAYLVSCPWCISIYAAGAVVLIENFAPQLNTVLAASSATGLLYTNLAD